MPVHRRGFVPHLHRSKAAARRPTGFRSFTGQSLARRLSPYGPFAKTRKDV